MNLLATGQLDPISVHVLVVVVVGILLYLLLAWSKRLWILNHWMIKGAILGLLINFLIGEIVEVSMHKGTGIVTYGGDGTNIEEYAVRVSENEYKSRNIPTIIIFLILVLVCWYEMAKSAKKEAEKSSIKIMDEIPLDWVKNPEKYDDMPDDIWDKTLFVGQYNYKKDMPYKEWKAIMIKKLGLGIDPFLHRIWYNIRPRPTRI
jgi:hypothetical protein